MAFEKGKSGNPATQFSSENQPENKGRKGKTVSEFLKEYGEGKRIEFEIKVFKDGVKSPKIQKGTIESETSINELIAVTIIKKAIQGDNKAMTTYLERTEGRVNQNLNVGGQEDNPVQHDVKVEIISTGIKIVNSVCFGSNLTDEEQARVISVLQRVLNRAQK